MKCAAPASIAALLELAQAFGKVGFKKAGADL